METIVLIFIALALVVLSVLMFVRHQKMRKFLESDEKLEDLRRRSRLQSKAKG